MIDTITNYLKENNYLPKDYVGDVNIFLGRGNFLHFFLPKGKSLAVKVVNSADDGAKSLEKEALALQENKARYDGLIPRFIAFDNTGFFTLLIMEGVTITCVDIGDILSLRGTQRAIMQRLLSGQDRLQEPGSCSIICPVTLVTQAVEMLPEKLCQQYKNIMKKRQWGEMLKKMPIIPQHSDLAINNIGKTDQGLIVFDWEDYGEVTLPGFDLCVLLASGYGFNYDRLIKGVKTQNALFNNVLNVSGIKSNQYMDLLAINVLIFGYIKKRLSYGNEVIRKCQKLCGDMVVLL